MASGPSSRLLRQRPRRRRPHRRLPLLHQRLEPLEHRRILHPAQAKDRGPLHVHRAIVAQPKKHLHQHFLLRRVRGRQQLQRPVAGQGAHHRIVLLQRQLQVAGPVGGGQPAVHLLLQAQHLHPGALQVGLQPAHPAGLTGQTHLQPLVGGQLLVPVPPLPPAGGVHAEALARQLRQGVRGGALQRLVVAFQVFQEHGDRVPASAAPQYPQGRLPDRQFEFVVGRGLLEAVRQVGVRYHGQRLGRRLAHGRAGGAQRGQQFLRETVILAQAHGPGQGGEDVHFLRLFQRLPDGVLGVLAGALHQQQGSLALAGWVGTVAQRLLQPGGVHLRRPGGVGGPQQSETEQEGLYGVHSRGSPNYRGPQRRGNHTGPWQGRQPSIRLRIPAQLRKRGFV